MVGISQTVHHQQQLLGAGPLGDILESPGPGQCVLLLGHLPHQLHIPHLLLHVPGGHHRRTAHVAANGLVAVSQLPQHGNDRHHVVQVRHTVGDQSIGMLLPALPQGHGPLLHVHIRGQIVALRGAEPAVRADALADVVIPAIDVAELTAALGADPQIIDEVLAPGSVSRQPVHSEVDPPVLRGHPAGDQIVGIKDHGRRLRDTPGQDIRNVAGVCVSHDGVPCQIGDHRIVRLHIGEDADAGPLVHLQHRHVIGLGPPQQVAAPQQRRGDAGGDVGAGAVAENLLPVRLQNIRQQIADGGLAVGAGDGDDGTGLSHIPQEVRAQLQRQRAGKVRTVVPGDLQRRNRQLRQPQCQ